MTEDGEREDGISLPKACAADIQLSNDLKRAYEDGVDGDIYITIWTSMGTHAIKNWKIVK